MNWTCANCGKRVAFSDEQLTETRGVVVCPQCLASDRIPGYDAPAPRRKNTSSQPSQSSKPQEQKVKTPPPHKSRPTPPKHRSKVINFTGDTGATPPTNATKRGGKKKQAGKSSSRAFSPKSSLGCLWRSVVYTLLLLVVYILFGLLLQGI